MKIFAKMYESDSKYCRICLKIDKMENLSKTTGFRNFLFKFFGSKVISSEIWLCVWCKASVRQAFKLLKVAQQSQIILETCNQKPSKLELNQNLHGPYNLSFTNHIHEDITLVKNDDESCTFDEESTHEKLLENCNLEEEILNQIKQTHSREEETIGEESFHEENSIEENFKKFDQQKKKLNYKELKFEVRYLSFEEQLAEIEMKKNKEKYKNMTYHCEDCGLGFLTEDNFKEHMKRHEQVSSYKCPICKIHLKSKDVLSQHILAHRRRFVCLSCGALINRWRLCILHRYKCDKIQNTAVCGDCKKVFSNSLSLDVHIKGVHKKERKYACERCDRRFATKQRLDVHNRSHTNTRLFPCQLCTKSFTTQSNLRAHGLVHENTKHFYCVECNLYYKSNKGLKRHFRESKKHSVKLS